MMYNLAEIIFRWIGSKETKTKEIEETIRLQGTQPSAIAIPADKVRNLPQSSMCQSLDDTNKGMKTIKLIIYYSLNIFVIE